MRNATRILGSCCLLLACSGSRDPAGGPGSAAAGHRGGGDSLVAADSPSSGDSGGESTGPSDAASSLAGAGTQAAGGQLGQQPTGGAGGLSGHSGSGTGGVNESAEGGSQQATSAGASSGGQSGSEAPGHGGGAANEGGVGGSGGVLSAGQAGQVSAGAGGQGLRQCERAADTIEGCLRSADQMLVASSESATVSVVSVGDAPRGACSALNFDTSSDGVGNGQTRQIVLKASDARAWTLFVRIPELPADWVQVGDTYQLSVEATQDQGAISQTIVLAQDARIKLFTATLNPRPFSLPNLLAYGVNVGGEGDRCEDAVLNGCLHKGLAARVAVGTESTVIERGQTVALDALSVSVEALELMTRSATPCDRNGFTQMAGFVPRSR